MRGEVAREVREGVGIVEGECGGVNTQLQKMQVVFGEGKVWGVGRVDR